MSDINRITARFSPPEILLWVEMFDELPPGLTLVDFEIAYATEHYKAVRQSDEREARRVANENAKRIVEAKAQRWREQDRRRWRKLAREAAA